jgi:hypothetical protein
MEANLIAGSVSLKRILTRTPAENNKESDAN